MNQFWKFSKGILKDWMTVLSAIFFAFLSALGLGVGLVSLGPLLKGVLDPSGSGSLQQQAIRWLEENQSNFLSPIVEDIIYRLPDTLNGSANLILIGVIFLTIFGSAFNFLHQYLSAKVSLRFEQRLRDKLFYHLLRQPLVEINRQGSGALISHLIADINSLVVGIDAILGKTVAHFTKGSVAFIAAIIFDWNLVLVGLFAVPPIVLLLRNVARRVKKASRLSLESMEVMVRVAGESFAGLRSVKSSQGEKDVKARFEKVSESLRKEKLKISRSKAFSSPMVELISVIALSILAMFATNEILQGNLPLDRFILCISSLAIAGASFRPIAGFLVVIQSASAPALRLRDIFDSSQEWPGVRDKKIQKPNGCLSFINVCYKYPGSEKYSIKDVSLDIQSFSKVAFVGANGSGKTTLLAMVSRLLVPTSGQILIDSQDLMEVDLFNLRKYIHIVPQEAFLFRGTIAENVDFGYGATTSEIEIALSRARALDFVRHLPNGLESELTELGTSLSGGQRQRLAIARALLRKPSILILDEATSQIDSESEELIGESIDELCKESTVLIIAHRLSTIQSADVVVMLENGQIVSKGTHSDLSQQNDAYVKLWKSQKLDSKIG